MKSDDGMMKDNAAILAGAEPSEESVNTVRGVLAGFSEWVKLNGARIDAAKSLPYFIRDNKAVVDNILTPQPVRAAADIAAERHAARTPEEERSVLRAETLRKAKIRQDARNKAEVAARWKVWFDRKATLHYGNNVLNVMGGISDVSTVALSDALKSGNLDAIMAEATKLKSIGKEIYALDNLDKPLQVAKKFSFAKAKEMSETVKSKLDFLSQFSLKTQIEKLTPEMMYFTDPTYHMPHELSEWSKTLGDAYAKAIKGMEKKQEFLSAYDKRLSAAKEALSNYPKAKELAAAIKSAEISVNDGKFGEAEKMLAEVVRQMDKLEVDKPLDLVKAIAKDFSDDKALKQSIKSAEQSLSEWKLDEAKEKIAEIQKRETELVKARGNGAFNAAAYSQERKDAAVWDTGNGKTANSKLINEASRTWLANEEMSKETKVSHFAKTRIIWCICETGCY